MALADGWLLASASTGPATHQAAVYRRPIDDPQRPFEPCAGESDLPAMFPHNIDTFCLVAAGMLGFPGQGSDEYSVAVGALDEVLIGFAEGAGDELDRMVEGDVEQSRHTLFGHADAPDLLVG